MKRTSTAGTSFKRAELCEGDPLGFRWTPGRPSKYDPKYCDEIVINARKGNTFEDFACSIHVTRETLVEWKRKHPDFSYAYAKAKLFAERYMIRLGKQAMLGKPISRERRDRQGKLVDPARKLDVGIWKYFLACRFGWREDDQRIDDADNDLEFDYED